MKILDLSFPDPWRNLACDEALLDAAELDESGEWLRFWEPDRPFVVLGYSNKIASEVNAEACRQIGIPLLRRASGGGTVLQAPGCLNYSLVLKLSRAAGGIRAANAYVMEKNRAIVEKILGRTVSVRGHTDLCLGELKFSGNAQRRRRTHFLFHGTFLLAMDLGLVEQTLSMPPIQPEYRKKRPHADFLTNLGPCGAALRRAMIDGWEAKGAAQAPLEAIERLAALYADPEWIFKA